MKYQLATIMYTSKNQENNSFLLWIVVFLEYLSHLKPPKKNSCRDNYSQKYGICGQVRTSFGDIGEKFTNEWEKLLMLVILARKVLVTLPISQWGKNISEITLKLCFHMFITKLSEMHTYGKFEESRWIAKLFQRPRAWQIKNIKKIGTVCAPS